MKNRNYYKGVKKYVALYFIFLITQEGLALLFPILLKSITQLYVNDIETIKASNIIASGVLVFGVALVILTVNVITEYFGSIAINGYAKNLRADLFYKVQNVSTESVSQLGNSKILPMIMNDTAWLKVYNKRIINFIVYFPIAIVGSFIVLFDLNIIYSLITLTSVPVVLVFFWLNLKKLDRKMLTSIPAFDNIYLNVKEGIIGAKEVRIFNKAKERTDEFNTYARIHREQAYHTDKSLNLSTAFNTFLFALITIAILLYGAVSMTDVTQLVILNTAIQYVNKIWTGSHYCFTLFVDYIPRCKYTKQRLRQIYDMPNEENRGGAEPDIKTGKIEFSEVYYKYPNDIYGLSNLTMSLEPNTQTALVGRVGSGKNLVAQILLKYIKPTSGRVLISGIDIGVINTPYYRKTIICMCSANPEFMPGTIRENMKLLAPLVTDEEILKTFEDIGAANLLSKFDDFLNYKVSEQNSFSESTKNLLNLVRALLKPASVYVFNQCFEHIKEEYINKLMAKLKREKRTCLFITNNQWVLKKCGTVFVMVNGSVSSNGTHSSLLKNNSNYKSYFGGGEILADVLAPSDAAATEIFDDEGGEPS